MNRIAPWFFVVACMAQLALPIWMISSAERRLEGESFRFKTAPVDPADPFRGRYVRLAVEATSGPPLDDAPFRRDQRVAALLEMTNGFATIAGVLHEPPEAQAWLWVQVESVRAGRVHFRFPIDRYYMNEHQAPEAERVVGSLRGVDTWIEVRVLDGEAALEGLYVDGVRIEDFLATTP